MRERDKYLDKPLFKRQSKLAEKQPRLVFYLLNTEPGEPIRTDDLAELADMPQESVGNFLRKLGLHPTGPRRKSSWTVPDDPTFRETLQKYQDEQTLRDLERMGKALKTTPQKLG